MQIRLENVKYRNLDLNFSIENKNITGIVSNNIYDLIITNYIISNNICEEGNIKYSKKFNKNKIGLISISNIYDMINGNIYDFIGTTDLDKELIKLLEIKEEMFNKDMSELSTTQKIKTLFLKCLMKNPDIILIDGILERLDSSKRKKIIKLLIDLKKFNEKTIVVSSIDIDIIYELVDDLVIINNGSVVSYGDKFKVYENCDIHKPLIKQIEDAVLSKSNINLGKNDSVNELIKAIYREVR